VTLIACSKRRSLLVAENDDEVFMTGSLNVTTKMINSIVRSGKSEAEVTNECVSKTQTRHAGWMRS